jgi:basic membrane protein A
MKAGSGFTLLMGAVLVLAGCQPAGEQSVPEDAFAVGLVFDIGGRGDKSFNDAAYAGLDSARQTLGIHPEYIEPGEGGDRESALRQLAAGGSQLVFGVGFLFSDDIKAVAREFPEKQFACIDMNVAEGEELPGNLVALKFKEEDGSFLVGALAGLVAESNTVGFLGGMEIPLIKKFEAGYRAGVKYVNPDCRVLVKYAGTEARAFKDPTTGKELGLAMYGDGADIVFHASGSTGLGLFEAAQERDKLAIGVDADQYDSMPGHILTSMIKRVDISVYDTIRAAMEGSFPGGAVKVYSLAEDGVGYVYDARNANLIADDVRQRVEEIRQQIIAGEIEVPSS